MSGELIAIGLVFLVHVAGAAFLVWAITAEDDDVRGLRGWWPRDEGEDGEPPRPPEPSGGPSDLPLPTTDPSPVRLREPGRLGDAHPPPSRRPVHPPHPAREPEREAGG